MSNENLTYLDVRHNNLPVYYDSFVPRVTNGTVIRYSDNPVACDCSLRRVRAWLDTWLGSEKWRDIVCAKPLHLSGRALPHIAEEELRCSDDRRVSHLYQVS